MKRFLFFATLFAATIFNANAYDFSAEAPSGQTLYYNIHGDSAIVTYPGPNEWNSYYGFTAPTGNLIIPEDVIFNEVTYPVTSIGSRAFYGCSGLTSISIPDGVISIGQDAFYGCSNILDTLIIPASVIQIGYNAFLNVPCIKYEGVADGMPWGAISMITYIEDSLKYSSSEKKILIGYVEGITTADIPNSVTIINENTFSNCTTLVNITIPNSVTSIGANAFYNCSGLTSVTIGNNVTSIGNWTFYGCSGLTSVTIPNSVTSIGAYAFYNCSGLTSVTIPNSVIAINICTFYGCTGLTSVTIGKSVTNIYRAAFSGCINLTEIVSLAEMAPVLEIPTQSGFHPPFLNVPSSANVTIPCGSAMSYYSRWSYFSNFIEDEGFSFSVQSGDNTMGQVNILTTPTCQAPTAVFNTVANSGYRFDHWSDGNTDNPRYLTLSSDTSIIAMFVSTHSVNVSNALGGGEYIHGNTATLAALPQAGLQFDGWSDGETMNPRNIVVTSDTTLAALYRTLDTIHIYDTTIVYDTVINIVYDTTEYNHYYYDTTYIFDTLVVYDTTRVHDTLVYVNADTVHHYYYDTTLVYDTLVVYDTINHYFYDTTLVYDTLVYMHLDTLNHYYYDTTRVYDTLIYVNADTVHHYYYDTTLVYDTLAVYDTINHYFYDTTRVYDTLVYVYFDTLNHYYYDTTLVLDTLVYVHLDTLNHYYYDTTRVYDTLVHLNIDTVYHYYYDTTSMTHYVFDSTWIFDSVYIIDTIIIHDTIYITEENIDGVETLNTKIYINNGQIVVDGAEGNQVWLYDINGRLLATRQDNYQSLRFDVHVSGAYLVKIGKYPARRVVVIR